MPLYISARGRATSTRIQPSAKLDPLPETLNLCINSHHGLQLITELVEAPRFPAGATKNVFIQPGAESPALLDYCAAHGLRVHQGFVLIEMTSSK